MGPLTDQDWAKAATWLREQNPPEPVVWVRFEDGQFVCGDEDGEFARAGTVEGILSYVADLVYGPGTRRLGGLENPREPPASE